MGNDKEKTADHLAEAEILEADGVFCPHCGYYTDYVFVDEKINCENCRKVFLVTGKAKSRQ